MHIKLKKFDEVDKVQQQVIRNFKTACETSFKLLGYGAVLAAVEIARQKTGSYLLAVLEGILGFLVVCWVFSAIENHLEIRAVEYPPGEAVAWRFIINAIVQVLIAYALMYSFQFLSYDVISTLATAAATKK